MSDIARPEMSATKSVNPATKMYRDLSITGLSGPSLKYLQDQRDASSSFRRFKVKVNTTSASTSSTDQRHQSDSEEIRDYLTPHHRLAAETILSSRRGVEEEGIYFNLPHKELRNMFRRRQYLPHTKYWPMDRVEELTAREISRLLLEQDEILRTKDVYYVHVILMGRDDGMRRILRLSLTEKVDWISWKVGFVLRKAGWKK